MRLEEGAAHILRDALLRMRADESQHQVYEDHVVRKHDFIYLPPGVVHSIENTGLVDLVFLVVTAPVSDDVK